MRIRRRSSLLCLLMTVTLGAAVPAAAAADPEDADLAPAVGAPAPVAVPLDDYFDNDGIDAAGSRDGDFDGSGYAFPAEGLPAAGPVEVDGVGFRFPSSAAGARNNVVALGQKLVLPAGRYHGAHLLVASSWGTAGGPVTVHYADGTTTSAVLSGPDWYAASGQLSAPFRYAPGGGVDQHPVSISTAEVWLDPARQAIALTLPTTNPAEAGRSSLHVFALSVQPAAAGRALTIRGGRATAKLLPGEGRIQAVEATITNLGDTWITERDRLTVRAEVFAARTAVPAAITRLAPGEQVRVRIGITKHPDLPDGSQIDGQIVASGRRGLAAVQRIRFTVGVSDYAADDASLARHESPYWFDDAKFGIFIHWGVYSVPAWSPPGVQYAEWYWQWMQDPNNAVHRYHADTYGRDFPYDAFIPQFTAERYDPRAWVELFRDAGAKYYVLTSKHHEGFALFDSAVSNRDSVDLGPRRDLVRALFDASRRHTPELRNGLYFSMPEWFNPDNPWSGHPPRNPYTGAPEPYTGYPAGRDFVRDYQAPQLLELVRGYDPDIIWCDIGGANDSRRVLAEYFNRAKNRPHPKDVTVDDRCGIPTHDFTTPEYATYPNTVVKKWEASRGLDPRSYGWNRATPDSMYMTADEVIHTLVDVVSKNGNFLLDIGPRADGTIPEIMQTRLREAGAWLRINGEAIYGTTYWSRLAEQGSLRFTVRPNEAFYITSLQWPGEQVIVDAPVPIRPGDSVRLLGYDGAPLHWTQRGGKLIVDVPAAARQTGRHAWVFKIDWRR